MGDKIRAKQTVGPAGVPVVPGLRRRRARRRRGRCRGRARSASRCCSSPARAAAARACTWSHARRRARRARSPRRAARRRSSFGDDTLLVERLRHRPRATSRSRCWPTRTAASCTSASASAPCSAATRRSSRRRRRRCSTRRSARAMGEGRRRGRPGRAATSAPARSSSSSDADGERVLLPGDEHPPAGRAPGHRGGRPGARPGWTSSTSSCASPPASRCRYGQDDVTLEGHAVEVRVYAEDPARGFLPTGGHGPGPGAAAPSTRVDAGVPRAAPRSAPTTTRCWPRSSPAVRTAPPPSTASTPRSRATVVLGVRTNVAFLRDAARRRGRPGRAARHRSHRPPVDAGPPTASPTTSSPPRRSPACSTCPTGDAPFDRLGGLAARRDPAPARWRLVPAAGASGDPVDVAVAGPPDDASVRSARTEPREEPRHGDAAPPSSSPSTAPPAATAPRSPAGCAGSARDGDAWALREQERLRAAAAAAGGRTVR